MPLNKHSCQIAHICPSAVLLQFTYRSNINAHNTYRKQSTRFSFNATAIYTSYKNTHQLPYISYICKLVDMHIWCNIPISMLHVKFLGATVTIYILYVLCQLQITTPNYVPEKKLSWQCTYVSYCCLHIDLTLMQIFIITQQTATLSTTLLAYMCQ